MMRCRPDNTDILQVQQDSLGCESLVRLPKCEWLSLFSPHLSVFAMMRYHIDINIW